ncbi:MAG: hypothetical protein PHH67_09365 [Methanosarcina sp.]|jgi:hypothetical protein|nr:hypothetical protein [Methanosarcina sp.]MDD4306693.1 hypothetical protein [Methanosarcina sp.]MDD4619412.1 hypothetical protein [Methanosarcina sp.]
MKKKVKLILKGQEETEKNRRRTGEIRKKEKNRRKIGEKGKMREE